MSILLEFVPESEFVIGSSSCNPAGLAA